MERWTEQRVNDALGRNAADLNSLLERLNLPLSGQVGGETLPLARFPSQEAAPTCHISLYLQSILTRQTYQQPVPSSRSTTPTAGVDPASASESRPWTPHGPSEPPVDDAYLTQLMNRMLAVVSYRAALDLNPSLQEQLEVRHSENGWGRQLRHESCVFPVGTPAGHLVTRGRDIGPGLTDQPLQTAGGWW